LFGRYSVASILLAFMILVMPSAMSACSGSSNSRQQVEQLDAAQKKMKEEKESEKLKKLEENIESLFEALGGPSFKTRTGENEDKAHESQDQEDSRQEDKQQGEGQQESKQGNSQEEDKQQEGKQENSQQVWQKVDKTINSLHYEWNDLMPEITKKGADMKLVDVFDNSLNSLTTEAESRDKAKVMFSANKLYSHISDLFSLYRTKMSPELKRMIYYTRNIILESEKENWEQAGKDKESLERTWSLLRNTLEDEQKKIGDKLDFSIYELKKVVSEKNKQLADIKGRIALNNIKELSESYKESK
jgi:hypothetical protein